MTEPGEEWGVQRSMQRRTPVIFALLGGVAILLGLLWYFSTDRNPDQDKLINPQIHGEQSKPSELCTASDVYLIIKRQLFARAAQAKGTDQAAFDKLAGAAVLRMDNAVMESDEAATSAVSCSGSLSLDLPPGVTVFGGRRTLTADVDYSVQPGQGGLVVEVRNAETIVTALATLTESAEVDPLAPLDNSVTPDGNVAAAESANKTPGPASASPGRPSFDCANASTSGEAAICADSGLAALDVNMASEYRRALSAATPSQRQVLQSTGDRFLAYRDRCPSRQCMADAYVGRMREIRDIVEGRWQQR